ncbi:MAG: PatB family C-S lyase [Rhodocyclaceae bacterium]|nr:putative C-S lyase [Rhodocyclaceae bacterium]MBK9623987.1 putative C-S lyase [Rhodocyclaceae bacterium]MBL0076247.1 putative C-S lyase [Rhodocyclaceae bacterium]MBP6109018.1 PatB family C-S lyase [Rhodocyclaceae bacterium]MBP6279008.1 PatB family C-S lyase [Rhodocyclaceae bacterium]
MNSPFDQTHNHLAWHSSKWEKYRDTGIIPLWVADMDFAVPPAVQTALAAHVEHGVLGYTRVPRNLPQLTQQYLQRQYGWAIDEVSLVWLPGLVLGINLAVRAVCAEGDAYATFTPVYPPFLDAAKNQARGLIALPLINQAMDFGIDFAALESSLAANPHARLLLICHPHNPVGKVWSADELRQLGTVVARHDLIVCSDEVHCDLILPDTLKHLPFALANPELAARTITLMGMGKTYNIAGLGVAFAVIENAELRAKFRTAMAHLVPDINAFGYTAMLAAMSDCEPWRQELLTYLRGNRDCVVATMKRLKIAVTRVDATYLAWLDCRHIPDAHAFFEQHGVGLSNGAPFGAAGFLRLNFACPRDLLNEALQRMTRALAII